ncbi:catalase-related peroxidase [Mycobacterium saskatchewanense]|uniref:Catalase-related peroxidase n=1 Tax=Mycobacterium saskatchewanense TaxID=220927 RepID=A0AAJ3NQC3_9MYCO|nr:catalase family peroxidase [Mycobacterium saskatchewanense]ORW70518.1 catalase [Mycobacterium saskatchewanense]BBX64331.1 catalase-related peroxidase [Mycobacterium saskatchewanense]
MPLPTDEKLIELSENILSTFSKIFGEHPGIRPAHGKGILLNGTFTPSAAAADLSQAPHLQQDPTPVVVRFSDSTGLPNIPDTDPNALPKGLAVRFILGDRVHTDIIGHSTDGFPTRTGEEFLELLEAQATSDPANLAGSPLEAFLGSHPAALRFVQQAKPFPASFARESFFGVSALKFTNAAGQSRFGRYRISPEAGNEYIDESQVQSKDDDYLFTELAERLAAGPIRFTLAVQLAQGSDVVDDATVHWPPDREVRELGTLELTGPVADDAAQQKHIIFDPIPRVAGIEPSDDPLLELRAAVYLISGRRRRAA